MTKILIFAIMDMIENKIYDFQIKYKQSPDLIVVPILYYDYLIEYITQSFNYPNCRQKYRNCDIYFSKVIDEIIVL